MKNMLNDLWDYYQINSSFDSDDQMNETFRLTEECEQKLLETFSKEQKDLFEKYHKLYDGLCCHSEREAFVQGIKFATEFLVEALLEK